MAASAPAPATVPADEPFPDGWYAVVEHLYPETEGQPDEAPLKDEMLLLGSDGWIRVRGNRTVHADGVAFRFDRKAGRWETVGSPLRRCTLYVTPAKTVILTAGTDASQNKYETFVLRPLAAEEQARAEAALREAEDPALCKKACSCAAKITRPDGCVTKEGNFWRTPQQCWGWTGACSPPTRHPDEPSYVSGPSRCRDWLDDRRKRASGVKKPLPDECN